MIRLKLTLVLAQIIFVASLVFASELFAQEDDFGPLTLGPITLGAGCGDINAVLPWLESKGFTPKVVGELDGGFSLFIMGDEGNTAGHVMVVRPDGNACIFFRASDIDIPFLYMVEGFNNVTDQDRPKEDRDSKEGFETL